MSELGLPPNLSPAELLQVGEDIYSAFLNTKYLGVASFALVLYDYVTCLDQEIEFFWKGSWSLTRVLYFLNRYMPPWVFVLQSSYYFERNTSLGFCTAAIRTTTAFEVLGMFVVEAVLVARVYYLWSHARGVQHMICAVWGLCVCVAIGFAAKAIQGLQGSRLPGGTNPTGCFNTGKGLYWPIFLPTFIIQTLLFISTLLRIVGLRAGENKPLINRLLRDGGFFYLVVCLSVGFTGIGSILLQHPIVSFPALLSNAILAIHSICASHLILSIHSLAKTMGSSPKFLLSNIEISRVNWRKGENENELVVEINIDERDGVEPAELINLDPLASYKAKSFKGAARAHRKRDLEANQTHIEEIPYLSYEGS